MFALQFRNLFASEQKGLNKEHCIGILSKHSDRKQVTELLFLFVTASCWKRNVDLKGLEGGQFSFTRTIGSIFFCENDFWGIILFLRELEKSRKNVVPNGALV